MFLIPLKKKLKITQMKAQILLFLLLFPFIAFGQEQLLKDISSKSKRATTNTADYTYYADGSLKSDINKGIDLIEYDTFLKKVKKVNFSDGRWIKYLWDGGGTLYAKVYSNGDRYDFIAGLILKNDKVYQLDVPEGRAMYNQESQKWEYQFDYKDHTGNPRVTFKEEQGQLKITETHNYDPFGLELKGIEITNTNTPNIYGFQNKIKDPETNWIDFGGRQYDPTIGRFLQVDPLAEQYSSWTPYNYTLDNPIRYIDPNGKAPRDIIVLNNPKGASAAFGHSAGHSAVLIGDDKNGWVFISKEGRNKEEWYSNNITGGPSIAKIISFTTKADFDKSQEANGYTEEVRFKTDSKTDKKAIAKASEEAKSWYNVALSNCADVCSVALETSGFDPGLPKSRTVNSINTLPVSPNVRFGLIVENNKEKIVPKESSNQSIKENAGKYYENKVNENIK